MRIPPVFESLADKLQSVFSRLRGRGRLSEQDVNEALREVRLALLEADVNFKAGKELLARIKERAIGQDVLERLSPAQMVVKIADDGVGAPLVGEARERDFSP